MSVKPITPVEATSLKEELLPDNVIETWNKVIARNFNGAYSSFLQEEIVDALAFYYTRDVIFDRKYLDVEDVYEAAGWDVYYDKPAYNENYEANFTLKKK